MGIHHIAAYIALSLFAAGCQTTIGLEESPHEISPGSSSNKYLYILRPDNDRNKDWATGLGKLIPEGHILTVPKLINEQGAEVITFRLEQHEAGLYNIGVFPAGLTLMVIPGCGHTSYAADFEVVRIADQMAPPFRRRYEFSEITCYWLPVMLLGEKREWQMPRQLLTQFLRDYELHLKHAEAKESLDD